MAGVQKLDFDSPHQRATSDAGCHRRRGMRLRVFTSGLGLLGGIALLASSAQAAPTPIHVGPGQKPNVAIGSDGTAHVSWDASSAVTSYCRIVTDAKGCDQVRHIANTGDDNLYPPGVFVNGSTVRVLTWRCCSPQEDLLVTSGNGGSTFGSPAAVGTVAPSGDSAFGPGSGISVVSASAGVSYQLVPLSGSTSSSADLGSSYQYDSTVGHAGTTPVVAFDNLSKLAFTYLTGADPNSGSSWASPAQIGNGTEPHLAGGAAGLFLLYKAGDNQLEVRKFTGSAFTSPGGSRVVLPGSTDPGPAAFAQDPSGHLHAVWRRGNGNPTELVYSTSTDGVNWSDPVPVAVDAAVTNPRLAVGAGGRGLAVWESGGSISAARVPAPKGPTASFTYQPHDLCSGIVHFDASGSTAGDAPITDYKWHYDDGTNVDEGTISTTKRTFDWVPWLVGSTWTFNPAKVGWLRPDVTVTLEVTDANGQTSEASHVVHFRYNGVTYGQILSGALSCPKELEVSAEPIVSAATAVLGKTSIGIPFGCPMTPVYCGGTLAVEVGPNLAGDAHASRNVVIGKAQFGIRPGTKHKRITIKLNRHGRSLAKRHAITKVRLVVRNLVINGKRKVVTKVLRVRRR
jgi:hypothetical protein